MISTYHHFTSIFKINSKFIDINEHHFADELKEYQIKNMIDKLFSCECFIINFDNQIKIYFSNNNTMDSFIKKFPDAIQSFGAITISKDVITSFFINRNM